MRRLTLLMMLACVPLLAVAGCQTKISAIDGAGYELLTPSPASRQFIIANDRPFARQVAGHNRTCQAQKGCRK